MSDPSFNVTLENVKHNPEILGEEDGVVFDPIHGFIIERVGSNFDGLFKCIADVNNKTYDRIFTIMIEGMYRKILYCLLVCLSSILMYMYNLLPCLHSLSEHFTI